MEGQDLSVFCADHDLTKFSKPNLEAMKQAVKSSKLVIAALSDKFFESDYCKGEIEAAKEGNIKVIPVYAGQHNPASKVGKWINEFKHKDSTYEYIFQEQVRDVLNNQNRIATKEKLREIKSLVKKMKQV